MGLFDKIGTSLKGEMGSAALKMAVAQAEAEIAEAQSAISALEAMRGEVVLSGGDKLAKYRLQFRDAEDRLNDAKAALPVLVERCREAGEAEAEAARLAKHAAARAAAAAAEKMLRAEYPKLGSQFARLLTVVTEAALLVDEANADLPAGQARLVSPEMAVRNTPLLEREELGKRRFEAWVPCGSAMPILDPAAVSRIYKQRVEGEYGWTPRRPVDESDTVADYLRPNWGPQAVEKRWFVETRYREAVLSRRSTPMLEMSFPGLKADDLPYWVGGPGDARPAVILARLASLRADAARARPPKAEREVLTKLTLEPRERPESQPGSWVTKIVDAERPSVAEESEADLAP